MSRSKKPAKKLTGSRRMKELGYVAQLIWFNPDDMGYVHQAAEIDHRPASQFIRLAAVAAARLVVARDIDDTVEICMKRVDRG